MDDSHIPTSHNKSLPLCHFVGPAKYRREVFTKSEKRMLKETYLGISRRYEINFVEIGFDENYVHFLVQSVVMYSAKKVIQTIKSISMIWIFDLDPEVKKKLWEGKFWISGCYINTVCHYANVDVIIVYVKNQGKEYNQIHRDQLELF